MRQLCRAGRRRVARFQTLCERGMVRQVRKDAVGLVVIIERGYLVHSLIKLLITPKELARKLGHEEYL